MKLKQLVHDFSYRWHEDSDDGDLLRGTRLARVQELQALGNFELTDQERDFLKASVDAEVKRLQNEGNALGAVLADPELRRLVEPRLAPVIAEVLAEQQRQRDESVFGEFEETAILQDQIVSALSNVTNPRWHPAPAKSVGNLGARGNYLDKFTFPCCGKKVLGENSVSQFRADGCQPYSPDADKRSEP